MKFALAIVLVIALFGAVLYGAWKLEEAAKGVRTVIVEQPGDGEAIFTVDIKKEEGMTLVIHCDEDDYVDSHAYFLKFLNVQDVPLTLPGGPMALAYASMDLIPDKLAPAKRALLEWTRLYVPKRVILVSHSDCFVYDVVGAWMDKREALVARQQEDLRVARDLLAGWFRGVKIEMYYAEREGTQLKFKPVADQPAAREREKS